MKKIILLFVFFTLASISLLTAQDNVNFQAGEKAYNTGNSKLAFDYYSRYIKTFEDQVADYLSKIHSYDTSTAYEKSSLFPGFSVHHDWAVAYYKRGMADLGNNEFVLAGKDFDVAISIAASYGAPYLQKGILIGGTNKEQACIFISKARSLGDTEKALKQAYRDNFCWNCGLQSFIKGKKQVDSKQFAAGLPNLNTAIMYSPDSGNYYAYRGMAFEGLGKLDSAAADYSTAIKLDSNSYMAYYHRALAYEKSQKYKEAFDDLTKVLLLKSGFADAFKHQAMDCESLGMPEAALYDYQQLLRLNPKEGVAWFKVGLHRQENDQEACSYFQKALDLGCEDARPAAEECQKEAARKALK